MSADNSIMKAKNYTLLFLLVILLMVTLSMNCRKSNTNSGDGCPPVFDVYCNVRTDEIIIIPYHLKDTIKLQKYGDSTVYNFIQQSIDSLYLIHQNLQADCPGNKEHWQAIDYKYVCSTNGLSLIVSLYHAYDCGSCEMSVTLNQNNSFLSYPGRISPPYDFINTNINGKIYDRVIKFDKYFPEYSQYVLWDSIYGIVQINSNGVIWYRYPS